MACRNAYAVPTYSNVMDILGTVIKEIPTPEKVGRLLFGVCSEARADDHLQNNLDQFEWVRRNKIYPNFWGRYLTGENALTVDEVKYLHGRGCKIAAIYRVKGPMRNEAAGEKAGRAAAAASVALGIPSQTAIFLDVAAERVITRDFMRGYAKALMIEGYTPAFRANTDAKYCFDRAFSRGIHTDNDIFRKCLIWAVAPSVEEYDGMVTSHLIHPDIWMPFAPSGITRADIAVWQYGAECHPIHNDAGQKNTFDLELVRNEQVIIQKMF